jgi:hypothetical protein
MVDHQPTKMEQMTDEMMEQLLVKIGAMQKNVVCHHKKMMVEMRAG